jgi:LuxR family transcriptional regulator, maltose regulon positive regulatory protein
VVSGADTALVGTKLLIPQPRRGHVPRPHLVSLLEDGRGARLALVSAPTGFGKTSLLAEWAGVTRGVRFGWVSLDRGDADPQRFWRYAVAALEGAAPELSGTAARRLQGPGVSVVDEVLPLLLNELASVRDPLVLVLDDMHAVDAEAVYAQLEYFVDRAPEGVHVVVATQVDPPLRLGRLRALGDLAELRGEALRFSDAEAAELLNGLHGLRLPAAQLSELWRRTEGWVAGLNLAALSLRATGDRATLLERLPVDDRHLVDYLWEEVVLRQPREVRQFLMRTSVLERLCAPLADAVSQRMDSTEMLVELERSNLFVIPLDRERRWFRYHHLFRSLLERQLERFAPDAVADLHRRASSWFAEAGDVAGMIEHAIAAGDVHVAASELERNWLALYSDGHATTLLRWIDALPADTLEEHPDLALARFGVARAMGSREAAEHWLCIAERAAERVTSPARRAELLAHVARQRSMEALGRADVADAVRWGRQAVAELGEDGEELAVARYFLGIALFWGGDRDEAEGLLRGYLAEVPAGQEDVRRYFAMGLIAEACALRGDLEEADALAGAALSVAADRGLEEHPPTEQAHVAAGIVALARGAIDAAEAQFERAATLARRGGDSVEIGHALLWLATARARLGDSDGAHAALARARDILAGKPVPGLAGNFEALARELDSPSAARPAAPATGELLSDAELRVLRLLPTDFTYREIAAELYLSLNTVRTHAGRVRRKLAASTRDEAVSRARERGLL